MPNSKTFLNSNNEGHGFFGTMTNSGYSAQTAWTEAMRQLTNLGVSQEDARDYLDSKVGRHVADDVAEKVDGLLKEKRNARRTVNSLVTLAVSLVFSRPELHKGAARWLHDPQAARKDRGWGATPVDEQASAVRNYREAQALSFDGYTKDEFIAFLEDTLIPDLKESGTVETAKDFETAIKFIKALSK